MNPTYLKKVRKHMPIIYKEYLSRFLDDRQLKSIFKDKDVKNAFENVVEAFYLSSDFGNNFDRNYLMQLATYERIVYEKTGFKDDFLRQFMFIYRFYSRRMSTAIVYEGAYEKSEEKDFFEHLTFVCCEATDNLFIDLKHNNRWWEVDSADTLRRQFLNTRLVIPDADLQRLCRAYLGREINIGKEMQLDVEETKTLPPLELVEELDRKMEQAGYVLVNTWTKKVNGQDVVVETKRKPPEGTYYTKKYITREKYLSLNEKNIER